MSVTRTARAAVSRDGEDKFAIEDVTVGELRPDEVLVQVEAAGICHTDLSSHQGLLGTAKPAVLGHEGAGTVVDAGAAVRRVAPGDRVILTALSCGDCPSCLSGRTSYCHQMYPLNVAAARTDGTSAFVDPSIHSHFFGQSSFATLSVANDRNVVKVIGDLPAELAAPLGCGIMTGAGTVMNALAVPVGSSIAIFGCGAVGLAAVMAARLAGATTIVAVDMVPSRLELALELGATAVVNPSNDDVVARVGELAPGGVSYSIEAAGNPTALRAATDVLGIKGQCAAVGQAGFGVDGAFDWIMLVMKGASVRGVSLGDSVPQVLVPQLIELHAAGKFPFDKMLSMFDFDDINAAVAAMHDGDVVKPVLRLP